MTLSTRSGNPFFSVVVPIFNKEKYLAGTIESILNQTIRDFELLLIIDPSSDKSEEVAHSFSDCRIRIFKRDAPGPGGYAARNVGMQHAVGSWIAFLDADDIWYEGHLQSIYQAIHQHNELKVFCTAYQTETKGKLGNTGYFRKHAAEGPHIFDFVRFLVDRPICTINIVIESQLMRDVGGFPEDKFLRGADHETWLRVLNIARRGFWIDRIGAINNKNVTDSVVRSTVPYTHNHPVRLRILKLLIDEQDSVVIQALKKHSNSFVLPGIKYRLRNGILSRIDVAALFGEVYLKKSELLLFQIVSIIPNHFQKLVAKIIFKRLRNRL